MYVPPYPLGVIEKWRSSVMPKIVAIQKKTPATPFKGLKFDKISFIFIRTHCEMFEAFLLTCKMLSDRIRFQTQSAFC